MKFRNLLKEYVTREDLKSFNEIGKRNMNILKNMQSNVQSAIENNNEIQRFINKEAVEAEVETRKKEQEEKLRLKREQAVQTQQQRQSKMSSLRQNLTNNSQ